MLPPIVDTHLHFWQLGGLSYPWLGDPGAAALRHDYLPADLAADWGDLEVIGTVHVQAEMDHALDPALETAWLAELADAAGPTERPVPSAIVGYADLRADDLPAVLDRHQAHPRFVGIRQESWYDPRSQRADVPRENLLDDPQYARGLREMASRGLVFDLLIFDHQLAQAADLFGSMPELPVVLEHLAMPPEASLRPRWSAGIRRFADGVPHGVLKISGLMTAWPTWDVAAIQATVEEALAAFGPERCMVGSNFPVDRMVVDYAAAMEVVDRATTALSPAERAAIFHGTAIRTYGLDRFGVTVPVD